jgi:hypothetical protein
MAADPDARALLSDFGRKLGIPDVAFDATGACRLGFDDIILDIEWQQVTGELVVRSVIGELPDYQDSEFLARLLEVNLGGALSGAGSVGIDRNARQIVYTDHTPLRGMTEESFERFIQVVVDLVEAWRKIIASRDFAQPGSSAIIESAFASMIRV